MNSKLYNLKIANLKSKITINVFDRVNIRVAAGEGEKKLIFSIRKIYQLFDKSDEKSRNQVTF